MAAGGEAPSNDGTATRRNVLKGATAVGAFIALEAIGGVSLAACAAPKSTPIANGVIYPDQAGRLLVSKRA